MKRPVKDRVGEIITTSRDITWKVLEEIERGWSYDRSNGVEEKVQRTRRFEIECQGCKSTREVTYKNIFTSKSVVCFVCEQKPIVEKTEKRAGSRLVKFNEDNADRTLTKDGKVDGRSNRPNSVKYVGRIFKCSFDTFICLAELDRVISKNGKNLYRNFLVECQDCHTQKEALSASLLSNGVACPKCRSEKRYVVRQLDIPTPDLERKCEIMAEINEIWREMKRMQRAGTLNQYLMDKYDMKHGIGDEEEEIRERINIDELEIDYEDPDIDWNARINDID
jgi:hypothetical protein